MPIDAPDIKVVPRRAYAMWLMVVGSVLISFTGLVIRNMEAATALHVNFYRAIAFMAAVLLVMFIRYRRERSPDYTGRTSRFIGWRITGGCWDMRAAGDNKYNGCGNAVYLQRHSFYYRRLCLGVSP